MKKKINLKQLKVKSFVTDLQNEGDLKGGFLSGTPYYTIVWKASICLDICDEK